MKPRILVVEDDSILREYLLEVIRRMGLAGESAATLSQGSAAIDRTAFDLILTDLRLPDGEGTQILARAKGRDPQTEVIVLTAFGSIERAVEAIKAGAREFLLKPFPVEVVERFIQSALEARSLRSEIARLKGLAGAGGAFSAVIGISPQIREVIAFAERVAPTDGIVLISGETGVGKEVVAKAIHRASRRAGGPFVPLHASAIPGALIEAELFGHAKGAFTGAARDRAGLIEEAEEGTLFLDEVGEIPPEVQVKLLRFLQERTFRRVGENEERLSDCRIIAATNRDLAGLVEKGAFREDLYYRLNILPLAIPPLRARREDIPVLLHHFLERFAREMGRAAPELAPEVEADYGRYDWPGNVRELENVLRRAVALVSGKRIEATYIHMGETSGPKSRDEERRVTNLGEAVSSLEREMIEEALRRAGGVKSRAAEILGIKRTTLVEKLKRMNLPSEF